MTTTEQHPTPESIMQIGFGFWASKTLLSAIELGLFSELSAGPLTTDELTKRLSLHERGARDFFDALVSLNLLTRSGGSYANTPSTAAFLDRAKPMYIGGILEMANARLYGFWGSLTEALQTGKPQNEAKSGGDPFASMYADPENLQRFVKAMSGVSLGSAMALAGKFDWSRYKTFIDIGSAEGCVPVAIARKHHHLTGRGFDLEAVRPHFDNYVAANGLSERLTFHSGNFFTDELPAADVLVFGHILHDWNLEEKTMLLRKAFSAVNDGGAVIVYDSIIDDDRSKNTMGLLMSLNMLVETPGGFDYTAADGTGWIRDAGFKDIEVTQLVGPTSMIVGRKKAQH